MTPSCYLTVSSASLRLLGCCPHHKKGAGKRSHVGSVAIIPLGLTSQQGPPTTHTLNTGLIPGPPWRRQGDAPALETVKASRVLYEQEHQSAQEHELQSRNRPDSSQTAPGTSRTCHDNCVAGADTRLSIRVSAGARLTLLRLPSPVSHSALPLCDAAGCTRRPRPHTATATAAATHTNVHLPGGDLHR